MKAYIFGFLKIPIFIFVALIIYSCSFSSNPCRDENVLEKVKGQTAIYFLILEHPEEALSFVLEASLSFFTGQAFHELEGKVADAISPIISQLKVVEVGKTRKVSEGVYECNIVFKYKERKFLTHSTVRRIYSGKSGKFYEFEDFRIIPIEK